MVAGDNQCRGVLLLLTQLILSTPHQAVQPAAMVVNTVCVNQPPQWCCGCSQPQLHIQRHQDQVVAFSTQRRGEEEGSDSSVSQGIEAQIACRGLSLVDNNSSFSVSFSLALCSFSAFTAAVGASELKCKELSASKAKH